MTQAPDFIATAFATLFRTLVELGVAVDFDREPEFIRRKLQRRFMAELKQLPFHIRRLIFLIALGIELKPFVPRQGHNAAPPAKCPPPAPGEPAIRGLNIIPAHCRLHTIPPRPEPDTIWCAQPRREPMVPAAPAIRRWKSLLYTLRHRDAFALRLARKLQAWKAKGDPAPILADIPNLHRLPPGLALLAGGLRVQIAEALQRRESG